MVNYVPLVLLGSGFVGTWCRWQVSELYAALLARLKDKHQADDSKQQHADDQAEREQHVPPSSSHSNKSSKYDGHPLRFVSLTHEASIFYDIPFATLTVNLIGALLAGLLTGIYQRYATGNVNSVSITDGSSDDGAGGIESNLVQQMLSTGLLGCLTTLSSFHLEVLMLLRKGNTRHTVVALVYVLATNVLGFSLFVCGMLMSDWSMYDV